MYNIIYSEFSKLKRVYICFAPAVIAVLYQVLNAAMIKKEYKEIEAEGILNVYKETFFPEKDIVIYSIIYFTLFAIISGYIFYREYADRMDNTLYVYPVNRIKIAIGKMIVIGIIIVLSYILNYIVGNIAYYFCFNEFPSIQTQIKFINENIYSMLAQLTLIPIAIVITNIFKNMIVIIIYSVLGCIGTIFMMQKQFFLQFYPIIFPGIPSLYFFGGEIIDHIIIGINLFILMCVILPIMLIHFSKMEIK